MKKREEEEGDEVGKQQALPLTEPSKAKTPQTKGKSKNGRALQKATGHISHKHKHRSGSKEPWGCEFLVEDRPVDEEDSVMKNKKGRGGLVADAVRKALLLPKDMNLWQGNNSNHLIE